MSRSDETGIKNRLVSKSDEKYIYIFRTVYGETSAKTRETIRINMALDVHGNHKAY